jgi:hypothetical protein
MHFGTIASDPDFEHSSNQHERGGAIAFRQRERSD